MGLLLGVSWPRIREYKNRIALGWHLCRTKLHRKVFNSKTKVRAKNVPKRPQMFMPCSVVKRYVTGTCSALSLPNSQRKQLTFFCTAANLHAMRAKISGKGPAGDLASKMSILGVLVSLSLSLCVCVRGPDVCLPLHVCVAVGWGPCTYPWAELVWASRA